jgi:GTP cyclohydrolase III
MALTKYEVGIDGEFLEVYYGQTPDDAIRQCKQEMRDAGMMQDVSDDGRKYVQHSVGGNFIANVVTY